MPLWRFVQVLTVIQVSISLAIVCFGEPERPKSLWWLFVFCFDSFN